MFNSKHKSKNPIGYVVDTTFDFFLPKPKKARWKSNVKVGVGMTVVTGAAIAAAIRFAEPKS